MLLVAGASGFLGSTLAREAVAAGYDVTGVCHLNKISASGVRVVAADLSDGAVARTVVSGVKPDWIINCAASTDIDECERDPDGARRLNVEMPGTLAAICAERGVRLTHISTDSVFDGRAGGYAEQDETGPLNVYARTKLDGELAVLDVLPDALVIRTNFIGVSPSRRSGLADWLTTRFSANQRISGFTDVVFAPLLSNDLARIVLEMMELRLGGLYHAAASDSATKYEFACLLGDALGYDTSLVARATIASAEFSAPRPLNTSLSPRRLEGALKRRMASVNDAVKGYAATHAAHMATSTGALASN